VGGEKNEGVRVFRVAAGFIYTTEIGGMVLSPRSEIDGRDYMAAARAELSPGGGRRWAALAAQPLVAGF
jgi:hypothetical protein